MSNELVKKKKIYVKAQKLLEKKLTRYEQAVKNNETELDGKTNR